MTTENFCFFKTNLSKPVKQEVNSTGILPPLVFHGLIYNIQTGTWEEGRGGGVALSSQQKKSKIIENHSLDDATVANDNFEIKLTFVIKKIQKNVFKLT
jgi:hypothetical protein